MTVTSLTDRLTDRLCYSVYNSRLRLHSTAIWPRILDEIDVVFTLRILKWSHSTLCNCKVDCFHSSVYGDKWNYEYWGFDDCCCCRRLNYRLRRTRCLRVFHMMSSHRPSSAVYNWKAYYMQSVCAPVIVLIQALRDASCNLYYGTLRVGGSQYRLHSVVDLVSFACTYVKMRFRI